MYTEFTDYEAKAIAKGYFNIDLEPIKCTKCKSTKLKNTEDKTWIDRYGRLVFEHDKICKCCGEILGRWSNGLWLRGIEL